MKSKICKNAECGESFDPRCSTQVYCSDECRVNTIRYQSVERICAREECSTAFSVPRTHQKKIYCSRSCSAITNNGKSPKRQRTARLDNCRHCESRLGSEGKGKYFCNKVCEKAALQSELVKTWLNSGVGSIGSAPGHYIRAYVFKEQAGRCALCSLPNEWQGIELRFVLDHIDGNSQNNKRDNLRLVCPNCDSQLPTYKSKNKGNGRHFRRERYAAGKSY